LSVAIEQIREDYRKELSFSKYYLDDAAEDQPEKFDRWNQKYIDALSEKEIAQRDLKNKKSELDSRARELGSLGETDLLESEMRLYGKLTESSIANAIEVHPEVIKLKVAFSNAKHLTDVYEGAVEAFQQRRTMIKELERLFVTGYFGDVDVVRESEVKKKIAETTKVPKKKSPRRRR
jgi:hypothetical protein